MPLRDHFRPPLSTRSSWEALHGGWPMVIVQHLSAILPSRYVAEPRVHLGSQIEIDVAAFDGVDYGSSDRPRDRTLGTSIAWAPAEPTLAVETELADADEYEVQVFDIERGRRLVAAIELVSPRNKDRPESRSQFVAKCAALLRQQVCVAIIDLVTVRSSNLYAQLLEWVAQKDSSLGNDPSGIYAVSCRWGQRSGSRWLQAWDRRLSVGQALPVLPLWLNDELAFPLDLEASYEQTCRDLRMV